MQESGTTRCERLDMLVPASCKGARGSESANQGVRTHLHAGNANGKGYQPNQSERAAKTASNRHWGGEEIHKENFLFQAQLN